MLPQSRVRAAVKEAERNGTEHLAGGGGRCNIGQGERSRCRRGDSERQRPALALFLGRRGPLWWALRRSEKFGKV